MYTVYASIEAAAVGVDTKMRGKKFAVGRVADCAGLRYHKSVDDEHVLQERERNISSMEFGTSGRTRMSGLLFAIFGTDNKKLLRFLWE